MHSIKRAARHNAWYGDTAAGRTYNPFSRINPRRRTDEEHQLHQPSATRTDDAVSLDEGLRRRKTEDLSALPRSHTSPSVPIRSSAGSLDDDVRGERRRKFNYTTAQALSSETAIDEDVSAGECPAGGRTSGATRMRQKLTNVFKGKERAHPVLPLMSQIRAVFGSWTTFLLAFVPIGFAVNYTHQNPILAFVMNFVAIIPSTTIIGFAIDNLTLYVGDTIGALLSMTFSNAVQLISSIFLLKSRQIGVLRSSLLGGILQSLLVMTGLAFVLGGINRVEQYFNAQLAQTIGMLLLLAVLSLMVPTVSQLWNHSSQAGIAAQSRGTAVVIIISYVLWLVFQLKTHRAMFEPPSKKAPKRITGKKDAGDALRGIATIGAASGAAVVGGKINQEYLLQEVDEDDEEESPMLSVTTTLVSLVIFTTLLAFNTQFATDSVQGIMTDHNISEEFMGIVVLPILSNDPFTIDSAVKDKMDISIALTLERCMQTALMVVPLIVLLAWAMGIDEMTLDFDGFSVAALFASIIIVTYVVQEGRSNWLTGALLLKVFVIIGLASFYIEPDTQS